MTVAVTVELRRWGKIEPGQDDLDRMARSLLHIEGIDGGRIDQVQTIEVRLGAGGRRLALEWLGRRKRDGLGQMRKTHLIDLDDLSVRQQWLVEVGGLFEQLQAALEASAVSVGARR